MDLLSPLFQLLFRAIVILLPLTVGWLALRRLVLSRTSNAWIYAITCLFGTVTFAGLLPWTLGFGHSSSIFFLLSALSPAVWMLVIVICDPTAQLASYDSIGPAPLEPDTPEFSGAPTPAPTQSTPTRSTPLILEEPAWPDMPVPMFRHRAIAANLAAGPESLKKDVAKSILSVARGMRRNATSDSRRPKMLPAPDKIASDLPFLNRS